MTLKKEEVCNRSECPKGQNVRRGQKNTATTRQASQSKMTVRPIDAVVEEEENVRNVRARLGSVGSESDTENGIDVLGFPEFVGTDDDEYLPSDDEEFNKLEDYFELLDVDRAPRALVELPEGEITLAWCASQLNAELERMLRSDCYRRRTLSKLMSRFDTKTHVDGFTYRLMCQLSPFEAGESCESWMSRVRAEQPINFLKLCILYYVHRDHEFQVFKAPEAESVLSLENLPGSLTELLTDFARRNCGFTMRLLPELQRRGAKTQYKLTDLFRRLAKPAFRMRLIRILGEEARSARVGKLLIRRLFPSDVVTLVDAYLEPTYLHYPVRGPFRASYVGTSPLKCMYGPSPNPFFYYCNCVKTGALCGHNAMSVRVRPEFFF